jgi:transposase
MGIGSWSATDGRESGGSRSGPARSRSSHVILDNYSTHKTPAIRRWLAAHPGFVLHFTPTGASWINLVERFFGELTARKLQRSAHRSVKALNADIQDWIENWNEDPQPYVWTRTADEILQKLAGYCNTINASGH